LSGEAMQVCPRHRPERAVKITAVTVHMNSLFSIFIFLFSLMRAYKVRNVNTLAPQPA
jgi:hypothetical protein